MKIFSSTARSIEREFNKRNMHPLETRRDKIRKLINLAIQDRNPVKQAQGYSLLREINNRLNHAYSFKNKN